MTRTERLHDDLNFVRQAVLRRDSPAPTPRAILIIWGVYVLVGYTMLDFNHVAASWFFLIAGVVGGIGSFLIGKREAARVGQVDRAEGIKHALHWGSIFIAVIAIVALMITRRDQWRGSGEIVGQLIALVIGVIYFLAGVHFDRRFIWLGLLLMAGSIAISFVPRFGWTTLGTLMAAGLIVPAVLRKSVPAPATEPSSMSKP